MRNSTTKVIDGKVVFSKEILKYFESLRNEETSEWINKYFPNIKANKQLKLLNKKYKENIYSINVYSNRNWIFIFFSKTYI